MASGFIPAGARSSTAVDGKSDFTDQNLYSSIVLADGGSGSMKLFTVPQGQPIPQLKGAATLATVNPWQMIHSKLTTIIEKAGELGKGIGDAAVRGIACHLEQAKIPSTGVLPSGTTLGWGATDFEVIDVLSKCSLELRVSKKPMFTAPIFTFPTMGGAYGSLAIGSNAASTAMTKNTLTTIGVPGNIRRLRAHIPVERQDTLEAEFEVAGNSTLAFRETGSSTVSGIPTLFFVVLPSTLRGDVR